MPLWGTSKNENLFAPLRLRVSLHFQVNRVQKVLEHANIKLASVATDVLGVSGRRMLEALVADKTDAATMAELAKGRLRTKLPLLQQALTGWWMGSTAF